MLSRTSHVQYIEINSLLSCSLCQIGDSTHMSLLTRALAVKREYPLFYGREGDFDDYVIFSEPIPQAAMEPINMRVTNEIPMIHVNRIDVTGCSFSSVVHVGSTCVVYAESRVKHIRQLQGDQPQIEKTSLEKQLASSLNTSQLLS
ncbi:spore germination protein GerPE [Priestia megaterium]|nr:spore germination protein GerPE [Priestia megaterium]